MRVKYFQKLELLLHKELDRRQEISKKYQHVCVYIQMKISVGYSNYNNRSVSAMKIDEVDQTRKLGNNIKILCLEERNYFLLVCLFSHYLVFIEHLLCPDP